MKMVKVEFIAVGMLKKLIKYKKQKSVFSKIPLNKNYIDLFKEIEDLLELN